MTAKRKAAAVLVGLLIAGLLALIWFFSAQPGPQSNALSQAVQSDLQQKGLNSLTPGLGLLGAQQAVRKWAHTYLYLLLGGLCAAFCRLLGPLSPLGPRLCFAQLQRPAMNGTSILCRAAAAKCVMWHWMCWGHWRVFCFWRQQAGFFTASKQNCRAYDFTVGPAVFVFQSAMGTNRSSSLPGMGSSKLKKVMWAVAISVSF